MTNKPDKKSLEEHQKEHQRVLGFLSIGEAAGFLVGAVLMVLYLGINDLVNNIGILIGGTLGLGIGIGKTLDFILDRRKK